MTPAYRTLLDQIRQNFPQPVSDQVHDAYFVFSILRALDQVAYVRFASVYRSFEDVRAFLDEIERLENELPPELRKSQLNLLPIDADKQGDKH